MSSPKQDPIESALSLILDSLAAALIPLGITPAQLAQIARTSFVKVGARHARMRSSGRPHLAKIAALTGLTRAEVKKIVSAGYRRKNDVTEDAPRASRVLHGWMKSPHYLVRGKPRALPIVGKPPSFDSLCKEFSGDIPRKVILDELQRQRSIVFSRSKQWVSVSPKSKRDSRAPREQAALSFAAALMSEALRVDAVVLKRRQRIVTTRDLPDSYVEGAVADRLSELLDQMPNLFATTGRPSRHILNAYTLIVRPPPANRHRGR
jgi:hypothetical protein